MPIILRKNRTVLFFLILLLFVSCNEKKKDGYIARVGDAFLTESMIDSIVGEPEGNKLYREELIRKWVEKRVIYLSAVDKGILESKKYSNLINEAKVEIANSIVISELIEKNTKNISKKELEEYYVKNISEFKIRADRFMYNQVSFGNKSVANKFRRQLVSKNWENVLDEFSNDDVLLFSVQNKFEYIYNILPRRIRIELSRLNENGVSGVIETSQGVFTILQLVKNYKKNDVPEFYEIKSEIEGKYIAKNRKEIYNNFIKQLYSEYRIEIER